MNLSFAQIVPLDAKGLRLAEWEAVCDLMPTVVSVDPTAFQNVWTGEIEYRSRPNAKVVLSDGEQAVSLMFSNGLRERASSIDVTYAEGYFDLARDTCDNFAKTFQYAIKPASNALVEIEKKLIEFADSAVTIKTANGTQLAEVLYTSMDDGGRLYAYLIDAEQKQYTEGLCRFFVPSIKSIEKADFACKTARLRSQTQVRIEDQLLLLDRQ